MCVVPQQAFSDALIFVLKALDAHRRPKVAPEKLRAVFAKCYFEE